MSDSDKPIHGNDADLDQQKADAEQDARMKPFWACLAGIKADLDRQNHRYERSGGNEPEEIGFGFTDEQRAAGFGRGKNEPSATP